MRFFVPFYIILCSLQTPSGIAQSINFEDGFEDGNFTSGPVWSGDNAQFTIVQEMNYLLKLNSSDTEPASLSTSSTNVEGIWEFYIEFDGFEPSGSNRAEIFLMSDIPNLEGPVNGYAVQTGESGDDVFRIVRYDNGSEAVVVLSDTTVISSNGGGYKVKVTRSSGGIWQLEVGSGYDGILYDPGKTGLDNTHTTSSYFGLLVHYTSSRADKFLFDFKIDLPPFTVTEASAIENRVEMIFNRSYDPATVQASDFFMNNNMGVPSSVRFPGPRTVLLSYENPLPSNKYTVTVSGIKDLNGKLIAPDTAIPFMVFGSFSPGDVVINEFAYDPLPGAAEYVELWNTSEEYLNLKNGKLGDDAALNAITGVTYVLEPDHYLVISADTTALFNIFGHRPYIQMSDFPSLNNTGDAVRIITDNGSVADSLTYTSGWGGNGAALERRSGSVTSAFPENWGESPHPLGGTPGRPNSILTDKTAPEFKKLIIPNETSLQLIFSERIEAGNATDLSNYSISPYKDIRFIATQTDTVTLFLSQELQSGQRYRVTVKNIQDVFGNSIVQSTREEIFIKFSPAQKGNIIINEILFSRLNGGSPEFIELYNPTGKNFNLSGWKLGDAAGAVTLNPDITLKAGHYLVLTDNAAFADNLTNGEYMPDFPSLNDNGDAVYLQTATGQTIDSLFYLSGWGGSEKGYSLERKDPLAASGDPSNWQTHSASGHYTAGAINASYEPDETPPAVVFSGQLAGGGIEVRFSEFIRLTPDLVFHRDGQSWMVDFFDPSRANRIVLQDMAAKSKASEPAAPVTIQNLTDVKGNITPSADIPVAQKMKPGTVVINEIMYNPLDNPDDNRPDQSEYMELRNTKNYAISLEGLFIHDAPDEDGEVRSLIPVTTAAKWIPAQGIALIYADEAPAFEQSQLAGFFELAGHNLSSAIRMNRSTLSLASSGDAVYLTDSTGVTIDSVFYDKSWQNPNLIDTRGIALERINPSGPGNDRTNWSSSTHAKGGTPYDENSLYQTPENTPDNVGISFSPNPFSPDGDGYEDNLIINYRLDEAGYLLNVLIYDRYGRLVRKLANGKPAGFEGSLIWDGRKNNGTGNRIGIYIVVFEAFNSTSGKKQAFRKTVVLARRLD